MIELVCGGASRRTIDRDDFNYHECIRIWQGHCATTKVAWRFWGVAHALRRSNDNDELTEILHRHRRVMSRWDRVILQVCGLHGVNLN